MSIDQIRHKMPEKQLQADIVQLAETLGWTYYHTYDSRRSNPGFPDLMLVRERVIWAELKVGTNVLSPAQTEFAARLLVAKQEWYEWRPEHWFSGEIDQILMRRS